tara:strand:- start:203 stop:499 length:297 start_codon:yes stop_codon:yes gene_type:complete
MAEKFQKLIIDDLMHYEISVKDEYKDLNSIVITFIIKGTDNASAIEEILDAYVNEHTRIRYSMLIHWTHADRKYPSSIRINKKLKKVVTREQKKILVL